MFNFAASAVSDWPYDNVLAAGSIVHHLVPAAGKLFHAQSVTASVPEPATWLTMLIGFAMLGLVARVRKPRAIPQA
jgi:hypothetical protein